MQFIDRKAKGKQVKSERSLAGESNLTLLELDREEVIVRLPKGVGVDKLFAQATQGPLLYALESLRRELISGQAWRTRTVAVMREVDRRYEGRGRDGRDGRRGEQTRLHADRTGAALVDVCRGRQSRGC